MIEWDAVANAIRDYQLTEDWNVDTYNQWMLSNWGIIHTGSHIEVVDEQKYAMFLLKYK